MRLRRSTKAGAETPATVGELEREVLGGSGHAQRRPGPKPRRQRPVRSHPANILAAQRRPGPKPRRQGPGRRSGAGASLARSTKAGAETPATAARVSSSSATRGYRSTKAGAETPATDAGLPVVIQGAPRALNEGRGRNPGDSRSPAQRRGDRRPRSTKAGAETPATGDVAAAVDDERPGRSTKAGAETPATAAYLERYGAPSEERSTKAGAETPATAVSQMRAAMSVLLRSTKAGAETPATDELASVGNHESSTTLNEGRGRNPGDSARQPPAG